jgi:hypothetical protein
MRYIVFALVLAGCATQEDIAARQRLQAQQEEAGRIAYFQRIVAQCRQYGFADESPDMKNCIMQVDQANKAQLRGVILQQIMQDESARQQRALPLCSQLPPGLAGYSRSKGECR